MAKLWGGRFKKGLTAEAREYSYSLATDQLLLPYDIALSIAHVQMLAKIKIITAADSKKIQAGLKQILRQYQNRDLSGYSRYYEDIHSFIQDKLEKQIGSAAKKLHTARSRNDQVVTAVRMYTKEHICKIEEAIAVFQKELVLFAAQHRKLIIPGFTHLQLAQPVLMAHHLLAYVEMLERDKERLQDLFKRVDILSLGSASIGGTTLPIDRKFVAQQLGFSIVSQNSMDAVSDRDFLVEMLSALSILFMHLSRFCEDWIVWNSQPFGLVEFSDAYATGSSLMPQKKNPDMLELCRGKTGLLYGHLTQLLVLQKGLPLTYNRDLQEDKKPLFEAVTTTLQTLPVLAGVVATAKVNEKKCTAFVRAEELFATDLLDYLVKKGVAFSDAHYLIGKILLFCTQRKKTFSQLTLEEYKDFYPGFDKKVFDVFRAEVSVSAKNVEGGTGFLVTEKRLSHWKKKLGLK